MENKIDSNEIGPDYVDPSLLSSYDDSPASNDCNSTSST